MRIWTSKSRAPLLCLIIIFIPGIYSQVIPEWLGSILKRAAFLLSRIYYGRERRQFLVAWPTQKSIQEAEMNQQKTLRNWLLVGDQPLLMTVFVLIKGLSFWNVNLPEMIENQLISFELAAFLKKKIGQFNTYLLVLMKFQWL